MAVPTLVYHFYSSGLSQPASGLSTVALTIRLSMPCLAGNCLVVWVSYDNGTSITSIADNLSQTWPAAEVSVDAGAGNVITSVFVLPNSKAGVQAITVNFSAGSHPCVCYQEYCNVATSTPVAQHKTAQTSATSTIATGAFGSSTVTGNLVLQMGMANPGGVGGQTAHVVSAFTAGTSFTLLGCQRNTDLNNPFGFQARLADGTAINSSFTATQATHDAWNTIAVELTAAAAGTMPTGVGIRILKTQFFLRIAASTTFTDNFPYAGNMVVMRTTQNATTTLNTDSQGNTWIKDQSTVGYPQFQHVLLKAPSGTYTLSYKSSTQTNNTFLFEDIIGANVQSPVGAISSTTASANTGTTAATDTSITDAPDITPKYANSLILVATPIGAGPITGLLSPTPARAVFLSCTYPEETDFDSMDNADGYANYFNGADVSAEVWKWAWAEGTIQSWQSAAVEYLSAPLYPPWPPPQNTLLRM